MNEKSLQNLSPIKKGERRAMKGVKPKSMKWTARIENDNEEVATRLMTEHGSQTKVINYLLREHS